MPYIAVYKKLAMKGDIPKLLKYVKSSRMDRKKLSELRRYFLRVRDVRILEKLYDEFYSGPNRIRYRGSFSHLINDCGPYYTKLLLNHFYPEGSETKDIPYDQIARYCKKETLKKFLIMIEHFYDLKPRSKR